MPRCGVRTSQRDVPTKMKHDRKSVRRAERHILTVLAKAEAQGNSDAEFDRAVTEIKTAAKKKVWVKNPDHD